MSKKRVMALLLSAAMVLSVFPVSSVWALEEKPQSEAEKEAEAEKRAEDKEKDGETEENEEEEVASVEDANETIASYDDEEVEWEEVYISNAEELKTFPETVGWTLGRRTKRCI